VFYITQLDEQTKLVLEAEASGAFAKSDLEVRPDPEKALVNAIDTARTLTRWLAHELGPTMREVGAEAQIAFSLKADSQGMVMIGMRPGDGQFQCTLTFARAAPPARAEAEPPLEEAATHDDSADDTAQ
jgi:hypothetical protein